MGTLIKKVVLCILLVSVIIAIVPNQIFATNEDISIVKKGEDYIIYIKDMENAEFKFAFTNDSTLTDNTVASTLNFISNWEDGDEKEAHSVACLEENSELDKTKPIYMWIEKEDGTYVSTELNLDEALDIEDIEQLENLTEIIKVDTKASKKTATNENGVTVTSEVGEIDITDSSDYNYKYQMIKIDGTEPEVAKNLIQLVDSLQENNTSESMYSQIKVLSEINKNFKTLLKNATWKDVENMVIYQPEDSTEGDKYIVLLQQLSNGQVVKEDIQFMVSTDGHNPQYERKPIEIKKATALPVTYDSIILLIVLAAIIIIAIAVVIRMKKLSNGKHGK